MGRFTNRAWWNARDERVRKAPHETLIPLVETMQREQAGRYRTMRRLIAIYEYGVGASQDPNRNASRLLEEKLYYNMAQNGIDTVHSQICTPRIAPMPLTSGGTWGARNAAKEMGKGLEAEFDENKFDEVKEDVVLDGLLVGAGFSKTFTEWNRCKIERVRPTNIFVDDAESADRAPRCMYERRLVDKYAAVELYGGPEDFLFGSSMGREKAILAAPAPKLEDDPNVREGQVEIWEAYHLPSGPGAKDGRMGIFINGATLAWLPYEDDEFPYAPYIPKRSREAWWGLSTMRNYAAAQREFERMGRKLQESNRMTGTHILAHKSSKVTERDLNNGTKTLIEYEGNAANEPREWNPQAANPESYNYWQTLARMALENDGTSQFAAQSQVPAALNGASGKALQKFTDVDNKRKIIHYRSLERFVVQTSKNVVRTWKKIIETDPEYSVRYVPQKAHGFERIRIKDAIVDDCVIRIFPVGQLSQDPAAKFAQLDVMLDRGAITIEQFKRLYEIPDLEAENDVDTADTEIIDKNLDYIVFRNKAISAEPFDNVDAIIARGGKAYNHFRIIEVPEDRLENVRLYIKSAVDIKARREAEKAAKQAALVPPAPVAPMLPPGMPPPGMPQLPPAA